MALLATTVSHHSKRWCYGHRELLTVFLYLREMGLISQSMFSVQWVGIRHQHIVFDVQKPTVQCTLYRRHQNKWYPQSCLFAHFEATLDFCVANLLAHNNLLCYYVQVNSLLLK